MKKFVALFMLCFGLAFAWAQSDKALNDQGQLLYQYNRTATYIGSGTCLVTVELVNGVQQRAVSYRQEIFKSALTWTDTLGGETSQQKHIEIITANLASNEKITWKFKYKNNARMKGGVVNLERSCFFFLDENGVVEKKILSARTIKSK